MGHGFKHGTGGGGISLNYKVVGGTSTPANSSENTIWINTENTITSHIFSATEPENPSEGMVWIKTGTSSPVEFNALKKNAIQVYPLSAAQYVSGAWVPVAAMNYRNGAWGEWIVYLYNLGDECKDVTGGWATRAWKRTSDYAAKVPTLSKGATSMTAQLSGTGTNQSGVVEVTNDIDVTAYNTLYIEFDTLNAPSSGAFCGVLVVPREATCFGDSYAAMGSFANQSERTIKTLDISGVSGVYDIIIDLHRTTQTSAVPIITIYNIWLG